MKNLPGPNHSARAVERLLDEGPETALVCRPWEVDAFVALSEGCLRERRLHISRLATHAPLALCGLLHAARERLEAEGGRLIEVSCRRPGGGAATLAALVRALAAEGVEGAPRGDEAPLAWLDEAAVGPVLEHLPAPMARLRWNQVLSGRLERAVSAGSLTLVLSDYDEADGLLSAWVAELPLQVASLPLHVCLAGAHGVGAESEVLSLPPLAPAHAVELAAQWLGESGLDLADREALAHRTAGDVTALYRACLGSGAGDMSPLPLPAEGPVRSLLEALAVAGESLEAERLAVLSGLRAEDFAAAVDAALRGGWLWRRNGALDFLVPDEALMCLAGLAPAALASWHRRLAEEAERTGSPARAAWHALRGEAVGVLRASVEAACERARALGDGPLECALLEGALRLCGPSPDEEPEWRLALRSGVVCGAATDVPANDLNWRLRLVELHLEHEAPQVALAWLGPWRGNPMPRVALAEARALRLSGDVAGARAVLAAGTPGSEPSWRGLWAYELGALELQEGRPAEARTHAERALAQAPNLAGRTEAFALLGEAWLAVSEPEAGAAEAAQAAFSAAIEAGHESGRLDVAAQAYRGLALAQQAMGWGAEAWSSWSQHREMCHYVGDASGAERAGLALAALALDSGFFETALAECAGLEARLDEASEPASWARTRGLRAVAALYLGQTAEPLPLLAALASVAQSREDASLRLEGVLRETQALLFLGRFGLAQASGQQGLGLAQALGAREEERRLRLLLAELAWRTGDGGRAESLFLDVREDAEACGASPALACALGGQARLLLHAIRYEEGFELVQRGLELARAGGWLWAQAELCLTLGDLAWRQEQRSVALAAYDEALSAADAMGSPHHRALALYGLSHLAEDGSQQANLRARAFDHLGFYLDALSGNERREFLNWAERRAIADQVAVVPAAPPGAPSLSQLLRRTMGLDDEPLQESVSFLDEVLALLSVRLPLPRLVERLTELFLRQSRAQRAMFWLLNEDGEWRLRERQSAVAAADPLPVQAMDAPCRAVLEAVRASGNSVWVADAFEEPAFCEAAEVQQWGLRGLLAVPLKVADGEGERVIGCLYGDCRAPWHGFTDTQMMALEVMARHTGAMVEVGLLQEDAARKTQRLEMLHHLSRALAGTLDLDRLLSLALGQILQITQGEQGYVFFGDNLACRASLDAQGEPLAEVRVSSSVIARVQRERLPLAILDVGLDEELQQKASLMIRNTRSVMCVPLLLDDHLLGLIYISSPTANKAFTRHDLDLMSAISSQVALALENAQAYATIKELNHGLEAKVQARTAALEAAYQELTTTQAQLVESEKLASIGTLAGGVAHEINNPLAAILSNAQLLKLDLEDPEHLDSLAMIEEGAQRCKEIVAALLRYAREARNPHEPVDLRQLVADTLTYFGPSLQQAQVVVTTDVGAVPPVKGEAVELRKVLLHLLQNACEAIGEARGTAGGHVAVELYREEAEVVLRVRDDGAGMGPEVQKRIFDPFFTTKPIGSTGLGLSVVQRVVEKHQAQIAVESAPGEGTAMTLSFPALL